MIDEKLLERLSKSKDADVKELVEQCKVFTQSPYYNPLVSWLVQKADWEKQTRENKINIFKEENKPVFESLRKYFAEMKAMIDLEEFLRTKLTPEKQEEAKEAANAFERSLQRNGMLDEN